MNKPAKVAVTVVLLAAFAGAVIFSLRSQHQQQIDQQAAIEEAKIVPLTGLIALDVEEYFKDPRVARLLAASKLPVKVTRVGSRDMAAKVGAGAPPDFFFPSGVVAANQITDAARKANLATAQYSPFHSAPPA